MSPTTGTARPSTDEVDRLLAECLEEWTLRLQAGLPVDVEDYVRRFPEHAERLRGLLPTVEVLADLGRSRDGDLASPSAGDRHDLGDFRIVREVGRGGMGIVYEATQLSLGRRVALKVLPFAGAMDPRQLRRFHLEAHAAAALHHPHVVPVYGVGSERGVHYYAMQFIEGRTLADLILQQRSIAGPGHPAAGPSCDGRATEPFAEPAPPGKAGAEVDPIGSTAGPGPRPGPSTTTPAYFRAAARLGVQAAGALGHAHRQGIVHRDIKPSNLMVDGRGDLWLTDFGLARLGDDAGLTVSGDLLGTLRYMSPEQASGGRAAVDARTDVYSLGATLYELMTLRPAFDGPDRAGILRRIAEEEPARPRRLNPSVPRDLETIVGKAMAKEPAERYASAEELAEDLGRFLEDRSIRARPPTALEHAFKWSRRNRVAVAWAAFVLVASVVGLAVTTAKLAVAQSAMRAALARSESDLRRSEDVVEKTLARLGSLPELRRAPRLEPVLGEMLEEVRRFYVQSLGEHPGDPDLTRRAARAYRETAHISWQLGRWDRADADYAEAVRLLDGLTKGPGPEDRFQIASLLENRGRLLVTAGRAGPAAPGQFGPAMECFTRASELIDSPGVADPGFRNRNLAARILQGNGELLLRARQYPMAEMALRDALGRQESIDSDPQMTPARRVEGLGTTCRLLGMLLFATGHPETAEPMFRKYLDVSRLAMEAGDLEGRGNVASARFNLGAVLQARGRLEEAEAEDREAVASLSILAADFPKSPEHKTLLARATRNLASALWAQGRRTESIEWGEQALGHVEAALKANPGSADALENVGMADALATELLALGDHARAAQVAERGLTLKPNDPWTFAWAARVFAGCVHAVGTDNDKARYRDLLAFLLGRRPAEPTRLALAAQLLADGPEPSLCDPAQAHRLALEVREMWPGDPWITWIIGVASYRSGDWEASLSDLERSLDGHPAGAAAACFFLAMANHRLGEPDAARVWFDQGVARSGMHSPVGEVGRLREEAEALLGPAREGTPPRP